MLSPSVHETTHTSQCNAMTHLSQFLLDTNVTKYLVTDSAFGVQHAFCKWVISAELPKFTIADEYF